MKNELKYKIRYALIDYILSLISWALFFFYRKVKFYPDFQSLWKNVIEDKNFYYGLIFIPIFWLILYTIVGSYRNIFRRSRMLELGQMLSVSFIGTTIIFFTLILDDVVISYKDYYKHYIFLFSTHFLLTATARFIQTSITNNRIHKGLLYFNTLLVGSNGNARKVFDEIRTQNVSTGNKFIGYIKTTDKFEDLIQGDLPCLGEVKDIESVIKTHKIDELIIAIDTTQHKLLEEILLASNKYKIAIKILPDYRDIITGSVRYGAILNPAFIEVPYEIMPYWQKVIKRIIDIVFSILFLILFSPFILLIAIGVKLSSKGPIIYSHERIGLNGKPFKIYKFRSMYVDAEANGTPQLSSKNDPRVTPFGRFMRRYRLDEIPQFVNVILGNMSIVGPRPERKYFIDQIVKIAPHYYLLLKVKPGITSLGQVKFGYAENVAEMIERMKYDLIYIENMSLALDFKILFYTIITVLKGGGK